MSMRTVRTVGAMTMALVLMLVLACGGDDEAAPAAPKTAATATSAPPAAATTAPAAERGPSGTLNVVEGMGSEQWLLRKATGEHPLLAMGEPLLWWDFSSDTPTSEAILDTWESTRNADGSVDWTLEIKKGVKFHKGFGDLTSEDIKFTLLEMLQEGTVNSYSGYMKDWYGQDEANLDATDPYVLKIHQPEQKVALYRLFYVIGPWEGRNLRPFSKKYFEEVGEDAFAAAPVFAGPYEFDSHELGYRLRLLAVPDHYRVTPGFEVLNYFKVTETGTVISMLRTGQLDIATIEPKFAAEVKSAGLEIVTNQATRGSGLPFGGLFPGRDTCDATVPWVGGCTSAEMLGENPTKIRRALSIAIDRDMIIEKILLGYGQKTIANFANLNTQAAWWNPDWAPYEYDLPLAKQLLAEAGYPNCFEFRLYTNSGYLTGLDIGEAAASAWEQDLGCTVNRTVGEYLPFRSQLVNRDTTDMIFAVSAGGSAWGAPYMYSCLHGGPAYQVIVWTEFDFYTDLCPLMESTLDPAEFVRLNREVAENDIASWSSAGSILTDSLHALGTKIESGSWAPIPGRSYLSNLEAALPS